MSHAVALIIKQSNICPNSVGTVCFKTVLASFYIKDRNHKNSTWHCDSGKIIQTSSSFQSLKALIVFLSFSLPQYLFTRPVTWWLYIRPESHQKLWILTVVTHIASLSCESKGPRCVEALQLRATFLTQIVFSVWEKNCMFLFQIFEIH